MSIHGVEIQQRTILCDKALSISHWHESHQNHFAHNEMSATVGTSVGIFCGMYACKRVLPSGDHLYIIVRPHEGRRRMQSGSLRGQTCIRAKQSGIHERTPAISSLIFSELQQHSQDGLILQCTLKFTNTMKIKIKSVTPAWWLVQLRWSVKDMAERVGYVLRKVIFYWC